MKTEQPQISLGLRRTVFEATIISRCMACGAPGVYMNEPDTARNYPQCFDPTLEPNERIPVGDICPCCRSTRPANIKKIRSASIADWLWHGLKMFKRFLVTTTKAQRRIKGALSWK